VLIVDEPPSHVMADGKIPWVRPPVQRRAGHHDRPYHPDPRVVIDVHDGKGATFAVMQHTLRDLGYWPFRRCFEDGLRRDQDLGGRVSLVVSTDVPGQVGAEVTDATLGDVAVGACIAREARQIPFLTPDAPDTVRVDVTLGAGDEPVSITWPVAGASAIRPSLRAVWPALQECFTRGLEADPNAGGRVELVFSVDEQGQVDSVSPASPSAAETRWIACVADAYRKASISLPDGSSLRRFAYGLRFEVNSSAREPR
jgi:hypothetical protein